MLIFQGTMWIRNKIHVYACSRHFAVHFYFMTYHRLYNQSNMTGVASGAVTRKPALTPGVWWGSCCSIFSFLCCVFDMVVVILCIVPSFACASWLSLLDCIICFLQRLLMPVRRDVYGSSRDRHVLGNSAGKICLASTLKEYGTCDKTLVCKE